MWQNSANHNGVYNFLWVLGLYCIIWNKIINVISKKCYDLGSSFGSNDERKKSLMEILSSIFHSQLLLGGIQKENFQNNGNFSCQHIEVELTPLGFGDSCPQHFWSNIDKHPSARYLQRSEVGFPNKSSWDSWIGTHQHFR